MLRQATPVFPGRARFRCAFDAGRAFAAVSSQDAVRAFDLGDLDAAPATDTLAGRDVRALAESNDGSKVYAVVLASGNRTTVVGVTRRFRPRAA